MLLPPGWTIVIYLVRYFGCENQSIPAKLYVQNVTCNVCTYVQATRRVPANLKSEHPTEPCEKICAQSA